MYDGPRSLLLLASVQLEVNVLWCLLQENATTNESDVYHLCNGYREKWLDVLDASSKWCSSKHIL